MLLPIKPFNPTYLWNNLPRKLIKDTKGDKS